MVKWIVMALGVALLGAGVAFYVRGRRVPADTYQTTTVTRGTIIQAVTATGQLNPVVNVQVGSQISGRILRIYVDYNAQVSSNQIIAEIDPATYKVALMRAEAQLANAKANLSLTEVQARRAQSLHQNNLIPTADHDIAIAQLEQAKAEILSAEAAVENARVDLSRCTIYAPVDGVVISRNVDVGQTVAASFNTPTLFLIANDLTKMQIDALVSEADIGGVAVGQDVTFTVDAYPFQMFRGQVSQMRYGAITNQGVVNYDCVVEVNNADQKLLPGMTANVSIITAERDDVIRIPNAALRFRPPDVVAAEVRTNVASRPQGQAGRPSGESTRPGSGGGGERGRGGVGATGGPTLPIDLPGLTVGRAPSDKPRARTVYALEENSPGTRSEKQRLKPVEIRTGITDGVTTEVIEGLPEGAVVVTGVLSAGQPTRPGTPSNPFGGGGFRRF